MKTAMFGLVLLFACTDHGVIGRLCRGGDCADVTPVLPPAAGSSAPTTIPLPPPSPLAASDDAGSAVKPPMAATCQGLPLAAPDRRLAIHVVVDQTFGVSFWWDALIQSFNQFTSDPRSAGISMGLTLMRASCDLGAYTTPTVPIALLPGNANALSLAFPVFPFEGDKAALLALRGTYMHDRNWLQDHPDSKAVVLMIMEDLNDDCDQTEGGLIRATRESFENGVSIPTYVISLESDLDDIAKAGGTDAAHAIALGETATILPALNAVRDRALELSPCDAGR